MSDFLDLVAAKGMKNCGTVRPSLSTPYATGITRIQTRWPGADVDVNQHLFAKADIEGHPHEYPDSVATPAPVLQKQALPAVMGGEEPNQAGHSASFATGTTRPQDETEQGHSPAPLMDDRSAAWTRRSASFLFDARENESASSMHATFSLPDAPGHVVRKHGITDQDQHQIPNGMVQPAPENLTDKPEGTRSTPGGRTRTIADGFAPLANDERHSAPSFREPATAGIVPDNVSQAPSSIATALHPIQLASLLPHSLAVSATARRSAAEKNAEPVIRVNIGRIEVRAVMPQPEAPRPLPKHHKSVISLQEYLKQHNGG